MYMYTLIVYMYVPPFLQFYIRFVIYGKQRNTMHNQLGAYIIWNISPIETKTYNHICSLIVNVSLYVFKNVNTKSL